LLPLCAAGTTAAPPPAATALAPAPAAVATPALLGACPAMMPTKTIIQVTLVIGAIGIFWLSRSIK
jgi:hypothetical protein